MITDKIPNGSRVLFKDSIASGVGTVVSCDDDDSLGLNFLVYGVSVESGTEYLDHVGEFRMTPGEVRDFYHKEIIEVLK